MALRWGMIGGGKGSQIGPVHRIAAGIENRFKLTAAAFDANADAGRAYAQELGVDRGYGDWREMLEAESAREERLDLVTIATPNSTHFEIAAAYLAAGFNVFVEKPMTMTVAEADELVAIAEKSGKVCGVNYGYSGYPLVRQMRAMVEAGELGAIRLVKAEFAHGHHSDASDEDNPRSRWRYDPAQAGVSAVLADAGIHALHMASFVSGQQITKLSADFLSTVQGRRLEDDAMVNARLSSGATLRLWSSAIALGHNHGLCIEVFGEKGGVAWHQEHPNQLRYTPLGQAPRTLERSSAELHPEALRASYISTGHPEGMVLAFSNIYRDLADVIGKGEARPYPGVAEGLASVRAIHAAASSAKQGGAWVEV